MKSNVSKFLVKSIFSAAVTGMIASGFVCGMEDARYICPLCKKTEYDASFFKIHDQHYLCLKCAKERIEKGNKMCFCNECELSSQDVSQIKDFPNDLTNEQATAIDEWNKDKPTNRDAYFNFIVSLIGCEQTPSGITRPFKDEKEFIDCGLGICYNCHAIIDRPTELTLEEIKKLEKENSMTLYARASKTCPYCSKKNIAKFVDGKRSVLLVKETFRRLFPMNG